jgi:hypothetical protein
LQATNQLRQKGGTQQDSASAMFVFQSMSIFHILAIRRTPFMAQIETDPMEYAKQMEQFGLRGAVKWVSKNS